MSAVMVDSNVLLDIMSEDERWFSWSSAAIERGAESGRLVINPIIFSEVSVRFSRIEDVEAALPASMFAREAISYEAAFVAGKAFVAYRRRGGVKLTPLPDFLIGAHALVARYRLITRDAARYRTYFPTLELTAPN